ncbi:MAG TPA: metallophosphoesterase [Nitrososphaeraceae archaeon]|nr:metallophosphoesterase [Nitrososphaeraceae archaeon]
MEKISKLNNNIIMILALSSVLFFLHSFDYSSYSINNEINENKDEEFDYIFDPSEYIGSEDTIEESDNIESEQNQNNLINTINQEEQNNDNSYYDNVTADYNFVAAGDWYCNEETKKTINNILAVHPELIITTGDQVKESPSAACWIQMSEPIKDKMKIAIGNHDAEFANIYKQIIDYHHLKNPYYSHEFKNIHFISMSTEHPFATGSIQYEFIKNDLEKTSQNPNIDWIIVHQHKPLYSTLQDKKEAEELRDTYQQLFQQYDVDLVISSHNQYYERTYPLLYNTDFEKMTNKKAEPKPIITVNNTSDYPPTNGIVFLTVGTAGDELNTVKENPEFYVIQESIFGFLNVKIENNGDTLVGEFHSNDGNIIDQFRLNKT